MAMNSPDRVDKATKIVSQARIWAVDGGEPPKTKLDPAPMEVGVSWLPPEFEPGPSAGILYLRDGALNMPSICPKSMSWLLYFKTLEDSDPNFSVEKQYVNYDNTDVVPRFVTINDEVYVDLEDFSGRSGFSLDPRKTNVENLKIPIKDKLEISKEEDDTLETIETRKINMRAHLISLEDAFVYGCSLELPEAPWIAARIADIRARLEIDNAEQLQELLIQKMGIACRSLSDLLGNEAFFMDDLRTKFANKTKLFGERSGSFSLTMLDVEHAAISMLIMKCFEDCEPQSYTSIIKSLLHRHVALWSQADILYSVFIKERSKVHNYGNRDWDEYLSPVLEGGPQASGKYGDVYKVYLPSGNDWELQEDYYAFKVAKNRSSDEHLQCEVGNLKYLPYKNVAKLMGYGEINAHRFLITKWENGGDLEARIASKDLTLEQVTNILKGIAYALHMIHRTGQTCVVDLKPANILLNEAFDPILCDMGVSANSGALIGVNAGTQTYNDDSGVAKPARDIFGYGVILFRMASDEVDIQMTGCSISKRILPLVDKEESLQEITKTLRDMGCQEEIARKIICIGARCLGESEKRPSALDIYRDLQDLGF